MSFTMEENNQHQPHNFINLQMEHETPRNEDVFHPNGTLKIVGYETPLEKHSTAEIKISTPKKTENAPRLSKVPTSPLPGYSGGMMATHQLKQEAEDPEDDSNELLLSPIYVKVNEVKDWSLLRRRTSKIPQALPLQKVSKRRQTEMDEDLTACFMEEPDGEVVILMNGVLTRVGKPSVPTCSGKIYSTAQNCPITVKWLLENFESMVGQSLPRSFVYDQYVAHCGLNKIDSVNAASFGKLIRSVFLGLRTRRLGTRGNSKYHYYGIKIKETSHLLPILNGIRAEQDLMNDTVNGRIRKRVRRTQSVYTGKHVRGLVIDKKIEIQENFGSLEYHFPEIFIVKHIVLPEGLEIADLFIFEDAYKRHCLKLVGFFHDFKLIDVLAEIANFWRLSLTFKRKGLEDYCLAFSKPLLFKIVSVEEVTAFLTRMDLHMFQHVINILIPTVLRPAPLQVRQAVDNMIQSLLGLLSIAMNGFPKAIVHTKLRALTAFVRMWKQYAKMSQLSEFVELTLDNVSSVSAMRQSIKSIDLENICDRAAMILESSIMGYSDILKMMTSFAKMLEKEQSLEVWCEWADRQIQFVVSSEQGLTVEKIGFITADIHSCWLIISNLVVNAIREMCGAESSLFVPLLQWCGELMQYSRQRLLDKMKEVMPMTRFFIALLDEDMSINFLDKHKHQPLVEPQPPEEDIFSIPFLIPSTVRLVDNGTDGPPTIMTNTQSEVFEAAPQLSATTAAEFI